MRKLYLSWQHIEGLVEVLARQVPRHYDVLLVVTRGGMVPACLLSEKLDIRNILVAAVMYYTGVGETMDRPIFLQFPADPLVAGKRVLVVDDVWDSGRTITAVRDRVKEAGGYPELAVLHFKPARSACPGAPDYYAETTDAWIVYPWDPEALDVRREMDRLRSGDAHSEG